MVESTSTSVDKSIRESLLCLQNSFFQSLQGGPDALAAFDHEMTGFYESVRQSQQHLEEDTRLLIYSFVQTSNAVIPGLIDLDIASEKIHQERTEEITKVLNELLLDDTTFLGPETHPPYIQQAHSWLLNNLHNPYPSKQTRMILSKQTNTPHKDIDSWFTEVRKRIGWNSLRKKHFSTRKDMIAAATRFFKPSSIQLDPRTKIEDTAHFDQEFVLLEDNAKNLYSRRFSTSILANRFDFVKDVTPETNPAGEMSSQEIEPTSNSPYSSPEFVSPCPPTLPSPSPPPLPLHPSSQGRKRRQSTSDSNPSFEGRPFKQMRVNISADPRTCSPLPLTQGNAMQHTPSLLESSPSPIPTNSISNSESSRKRKRQLLDSDSEDAQDRLKRAHCIPSSSSNHLMEPLSSGPSNLVDLDYLIKSFCCDGIELGHSIPEPTYETSPPSTSIEIDFHRYASTSPSTSVSSLGPPTPPDYNSLDSPAASHQSLSWLESPLTKAQRYDSLADVTSELLSTNWSEESFLFDLNSPGILDADFPSQNWDLGLTPAISADNYSTSQVLQEVVDKSTQSWTNEEPPVSISVPKPSKQLSPLTSFSENRDITPLPQVFQHPSLDKKGAKIRYLQTLLNEVQNVRLDLAL